MQNVVSAETSFEAGHNDIINDVKYNYYGNRVASCSADGTIRLFEIEDGQERFIQTLSAHSGPVWGVSWSQPRAGTYLASVGHDGILIVYEEVHRDQFNVCHQVQTDQPLSCVEFAPDAFGCVVAAGCHDGTVLMVTRTANGWENTVVRPHVANPITSLSWGPAAIAFTGETGTVARLVIGIASDAARTLTSTDMHHWDDAEELPVPAGSGPVRDVGWAPNMGTTETDIAVVTGTGATMFTRSQNSFDGWTAASLPLPSDAGEVWSVSWNLTGTVVAVAHGVNSVTAFTKGVANGEWFVLSTVVG